MRLSVKRGIAGYVVASGQAIAVHDVERDPRFDRETAEATGYLPKSILAVPIETADEVSGVMEVLDWSDERVGEGLELAAKFARQAGLASSRQSCSRTWAGWSSSQLGRRRSRKIPDRPVVAPRRRSSRRSHRGARRHRGVLQGDLGARVGRAPRGARDPRGVRGVPAPTSAQAMRPVWAAAFDRGRLGDGVRCAPRRHHTGVGVRRRARRGCEGGDRRLWHRGRPPNGRQDRGRGRDRARPDDLDGDGLKFVEGPHEDLYGHGTACAGIVRTIAPEAELYSVRVLGAELTGRAGRVRGGSAMGDRERHGRREPLAVHVTGRVVRHVPRAGRPRGTSGAASSCPR